MEGDLVEKDSSLPQDLPDPIPTGGFERGSSSQLSENPQRKRKKEIDAAYNKRKREKIAKTMEGMKALEKDNSELQGQVNLLEKQTEGLRKEIIDLNVNLAEQNNHLKELGTKLTDSDKQHEKEKNALKEEKNALEVEKNALKEEKNALQVEKNALKEEKNALEVELDQFKEALARAQNNQCIDCGTYLLPYN